MTRERRLHWPYSSGAVRFLCCVGVFVAQHLTSAAAQDIRGLEICTAEKQMERRTGCLQANVEFLQQALTKLARETRTRLLRPITMSPLPKPKLLNLSLQSRSSMLSLSK